MTPMIGMGIGKHMEQNEHYNPNKLQKLITNSGNIFTTYSKI